MRRTVGSKGCSLPFTIKTNHQHGVVVGHSKNLSIFFGNQLVITKKHRPFTIQPLNYGMIRLDYYWFDSLRDFHSVIVCE